MDDETQVELAALLAARRTDAEASLRTRGAGTRELLSARTADNADDEHDPEGSTLSAEWSLLEGVRQAERQELGEIEAAQARMAAGTYGICAVCGRGIPVERLRARPTAMTHVACAEGAGR